MVDLVDFVDLVDLFELVDLVGLIQSDGSIALVDLAYIIPTDLPNVALPPLPNSASGFPFSPYGESGSISFEDRQSQRFYRRKLID